MISVLHLCEKAISSEFWSHFEYLLVADWDSNFVRRGSGNEISNCVAGSGNMITMDGVGRSLDHDGKDTNQELPFL